MTTPKKVVRKFAPFASFQKFLVSETSVGNINRQEAVSMIPPLVMGVKPGMIVLDLCAAPGSKSAQLIEMVHGGEEARMRKVIRELKQSEGRPASPDGTETKKEMEEETRTGDWSDDGRTTGLLIANDVDYKRAHTLIHQVKRLNSPNLIVMNHDATQFPSVKLPSKYKADNQSSRDTYLKFDRILADVPCSGDGTSRKNVNIWRDWTPGNALGLHVIQARILVRSLQMLKVGGRVVYSTCSMNPVENEAVVASAIDRCGGSDKVEIVDCSAQLAGLQRKPGLRTWKVMDKQGNIWDNWKEVEEYRADNADECLDKLTPGLFPGPEGPPLERCMRVYGHQQDTGAFFIAVLEKKAEIRARPEKEPKEPVANETASAVKRNRNDMGPKSSKKQKLDEIESDDDVNVVPMATTAPVADQAKSTEAKGIFKKNNAPFEEPFRYLDPNHDELEKVYSFYSIHSRFPRNRFMVRNASGYPAKTIYYTSELARDILTENQGKGFKFVHCGVKMLVKQEVQSEEVCRWRIQNEGLPILEAWVGESRVINMHSRRTLRKLLVEMFPKVSGGGWMDLGEIGKQARDADMGCYVLRVEKGEGEDAFEYVARFHKITNVDFGRERMVLPLWRSRSSLNLMLPKEDRKAMLLRLYGESGLLLDHSKARFEKTLAHRSATDEDSEGPAEAEAELDDCDDEDGGVSLENSAANNGPVPLEGTKDEVAGTEGTGSGKDVVMAGGM